IRVLRLAPPDLECAPPSHARRAREITRKLFSCTRTAHCLRTHIHLERASLVGGLRMRRTPTSSSSSSSSSSAARVAAARVPSSYTIRYVLCRTRTKRRCFDFPAISFARARLAYPPMCCKYDLDRQRIKFHKQRWQRLQPNLHSSIFSRHNQITLARAKVVSSNSFCNRGTSLYAYTCSRNRTIWTYNAFRELTNRPVSRSAAAKRPAPSERESLRICRPATGARALRSCVQMRDVASGVYTSYIDCTHAHLHRDRGSEALPRQLQRLLRPLCRLKSVQFQRQRRASSRASGGPVRHAARVAPAYWGLRHQESQTLAHIKPETHTFESRPSRARCQFDVLRYFRIRGCSAARLLRCGKKEAKQKAVRKSFSLKIEKNRNSYIKPRERALSCTESTRRTNKQITRSARCIFREKNPVSGVKQEIRRARSCTYTAVRTRLYVYLRVCCSRARARSSGRKKQDHVLFFDEKRLFTLRAPAAGAAAHIYTFSSLDVHTSCALPFRYVCEAIPTVPDRIRSDKGRLVRGRELDQRITCVSNAAMHTPGPRSRIIISRGGGGGPALSSHNSSILYYMTLYNIIMIKKRQTMTQASCVRFGSFDALASSPRGLKQDVYGCQQAAGPPVQLEPVDLSVKTPVVLQVPRYSPAALIAAAASSANCRKPSTSPLSLSAAAPTPTTSASSRRTPPTPTQTITPPSICVSTGTVKPRYLFVIIIIIIFITKLLLMSCYGCVDAAGAERYTVARRYTSTPTKSSLRGTRRVFSLRYYKKPNCGAWRFLHTSRTRNLDLYTWVTRSIKEKKIERKEKVKKKIDSSKSHRRVYARDKKELESREREKKRDRLGARTKSTKKLHEQQQQQRQQQHSSYYRSSEAGSGTFVDEKRCYIKSPAIKTAAARGAAAAAAAAAAEERKENDRNRAPRAREYISFFEVCGAAYSARAIAVFSTFFSYCCCSLHVLGKIVVVASQRRGIFGKAMLSRHTTHDTIGIYRKAAAAEAHAARFSIYNTSKAGARARGYGSKCVRCNTQLGLLLLLLRVASGRVLCCAEKQAKPELRGECNINPRDVALGSGGCRRVGGCELAGNRLACALLHYASPPQPPLPEQARFLTNRYYVEIRDLQGQLQPSPAPIRYSACIYRYIQRFSMPAHA
ncbi:unnamed protein product, partial [Trichogramma brassicae]